MRAEHHFDDVSLPSGKTLDLRRPRSEGPLTAEEVEFCRAKGLSLGYDPIQQGWVLLTFEDDVDPWAVSDSIPQAAFSVRPTLAAESLRKAKPDATPRPRPEMAVAPEIAFRAWDLSDAPRYRALLDDPQVWEHLPEPYPTSFTEALAEALIEVSNNAPHHEVHAVLLNGEPVGQVRTAFSSDDPKGAEAEISYWLGRAYWGGGIGTTMVSRYARDVFARMPWLETLVARIHTANPASARIAQRVGFRPDGMASDDPEIQLFRLRRAVAYRNAA